MSSKQASNQAKLDQLYKLCKTREFKVAKVQNDALTAIYIARKLSRIKVLTDVQEKKCEVMIDKVQRAFEEFYATKKETVFYDEIYKLSLFLKELPQRQPNNVVESSSATSLKSTDDQSCQNVETPKPKVDPNIVSRPPSANEKLSNTSIKPETKPRKVANLIPIIQKETTISIVQQQSVGDVTSKKAEPKTEENEKEQNEVEESMDFECKEETLKTAKEENVENGNQDNQAGGVEISMKDYKEYLRIQKIDKACQRLSEEIKKFEKKELTFEEMEYFDNI